MDSLRKQGQKPSMGQALDDASSIASSNPVSRNTSVEAAGLPSTAEKKEHEQRTRDGLVGSLLEDLGQSQSLAYDMRPIDLGPRNDGSTKEVPK